MVVVLHPSLDREAALEVLGEVLAAVPEGVPEVVARCHPLILTK